MESTFSQYKHTSSSSELKSEIIKLQGIMIAKCIFYSASHNTGRTSGFKVLIHDIVSPELKSAVKKGAVSLVYSPIQYYLDDEGNVVLRDINVTEKRKIFSWPPLKKTKLVIIATSTWYAGNKEHFQGDLIRAYGKNAEKIKRQYDERAASIPQYPVPKNLGEKVLKLIEEQSDPNDIVKLIQNSA